MGTQPQPAAAPQPISFVARQPILTKLGKQLNLSLVFIAASFNEALRWAHQLTGGVRPQAVPPQ